MNIVFVSAHPAPYRDPFFTLLSKQSKINLKVYHLFDLDSGHDFWNLAKPVYESHVLGRGFKLGKFRRFHPEIFRLIFKEKFDVIVMPGFLHYTTIFLLVCCALIRKKYILTFDTVSKIAKTQIISNLFYKHAMAFFVPGNASEQYLVKKGIPTTKILHGAYDLDENEIFSAIDRENKGKNRQCFDIPHHYKVYLMVANMTPNRDYPILFKAFHDFNQVNPESFLIVIGSGSELPKIKEFCEASKMTNFIIVPSVTYNEMAKYYSVADWYIHTGTEPYSTAVKYAAIAGIPIISSYSVGASYDHIMPYRTGIIVDNPKDSKAWMDAMGVAYHADSFSMGQRIKESSRDALTHHVEDFTKFILTQSK